MIRKHFKRIIQACIYKISINGENRIFEEFSINTNVLNVQKRKDGQKTL